MLPVLMRFNHRRVCAAGRVVGVVLLLFLLLGLGLAASSAQLHELLCPDAGQPDDSCVIKQFQSGLIEAPLARPVVVLFLFLLAASSCQTGERYLASPLFELSPSRAPPA
jgi:hypothetical protein